MEPTAENIEALEAIVEDLKSNLELAKIGFQEAVDNPTLFKADIVDERARFAAKAKSDLNLREAELELLRDQAKNS